MKRLAKLLCLSGVIICICLIGAGCKKSTEAPVPSTPPSGVLLEFGECKQFQNQESLAVTLYDSTSDCIEYQYDGQGTLMLTHINSGFNCCPGEITAVIEFSGNVITITEQEQLQDCRCLCLFDLEYKLENIPRGRYTIHIEAPYVEAGDQVLEYTFQLSSAASGNFCLQRAYYPWVQQ